MLPLHLTAPTAAPAAESVPSQQRSPARQAVSSAPCFFRRSPVHTDTDMLLPGFPARPTNPYHSRRMWNNNKSAPAPPRKIIPVRQFPSQPVLFAPPRQDSDIPETPYCHPHARHTPAIRHAAAFHMHRFSHRLPDSLMPPADRTPAFHSVRPHKGILPAAAR